MTDEEAEDEEFKERIRNMTDEEFKEEVRRSREEGAGWWDEHGKEYMKEDGIVPFPGTYATPVEKSCDAADYLILHAGQPLDFDRFHEKFRIVMEKGGVAFSAGHA